jgi:hypothetical protein
MQRMVWVLGSLVLMFAIVGCGGDRPTLAKAGGKVTYNGSPLEGATVTFIPDSGPAAIGRTEADGTFTLRTRGQEGAPIGPGKVAITAVEQLIEFESEEDMSDEDLKNMSKWLIPEKYGHVFTSGLTATIEKGQDNNFPIDLTD